MSVKSPVVAWILAAVALLAAGAMLLFMNRPQSLVFPNANSRLTYFTVHNILPAHAISKGAGVKVGILDHYFALQQHSDLYTGGMNFLGDSRSDELNKLSSHGYWLALTLREIAPEAQIYALNAASSDEAEMVGAIEQAIEWAIANRLDVLTYSQPKVRNPESRKRLDAAVSKAHAAGIVTTFINYPHPGNILPGPLGDLGDPELSPDIDILHFDYTVVFVKDYLAFQNEPDPRKHQVPFLSLSSTSIVVGGMVALMRSLDPSLTPEQCKRILVETSHPMDYRGRQMQHVADAAAALKRVQAGRLEPEATSK